MFLLFMFRQIYDWIHLDRKVFKDVRVVLHALEHANIKLKKKIHV